MKTIRSLAIISCLFVTGVQGSFANDATEKSEENRQIILDHIERVLSSDIPDGDAPLVEVIVHIIVKDSGTISVVKTESGDADYEQFVTNKLESSSLQNISILPGQQYKVTVSFRSI